MRRTLLPVALVAVLAVPGAGAGRAAEIHVPADAPTLQAAIDRAAPGDTVVLDPGIYPGGDVVPAAKHDLTIRGADRNEVVLDGAFGGAGMTIPPMVVSATLTAARIPLAQYAAFTAGLGVRGIWIVISATAALRGIVTAMWFSRGSWKRRTV